MKPSRINYIKLGSEAAPKRGERMKLLDETFACRL
jgi:hypothetical protein